MTKRKKPSVWFYVLLLCIGVFVVAIGVLRHDETSTDDSSTLSNWAGAAFMLICTLGPGLLAKEVFAALLPIEQLSRNHRRLRNDINRAEQQRQRALRALDQLQLARDWWRQEAAQITAVYLLAYREAGGRVNDNPYQ